MLRFGFTRTGLFLIYALILFFYTGCENKIEIRHGDPQGNTTTIYVEGLEKEFTVLQITDTHISITDDAEKEFHPYSKRMDDAYRNLAHFETGVTADPADHFLYLLTTAKERRPDLIALTGDIVNNPSASSVAFVKSALDSTGIPYLYTAGNHDWHYEGMPGSLNTLRTEWTERTLKPLYNGRNPLYYHVEYSGMNIVLLDNSAYQINDEQLAFLNNELDKDMPAILLVHIPFYHPNYAERSVGSCGDPRWGAAADENFELERRERWPEEGNSAATVQALERVGASPNLVAVLAGHHHRASVDAYSEVTKQYITAAGINGNHQYFVFKPLTEDQK